MDLVKLVEQEHSNPKAKDLPDFRVGDTVAVHTRILEGEATEENKGRIQIYQGVCMAIRQKGQMNGHFRVRKISSGFGVERIFPFHSPNVEKVELVQRGKTRRAKLFYLRKREGKSARISIDYER